MAVHVEGFNIYLGHEHLKGDSWREMKIPKLLQLLETEVSEVDTEMRGLDIKKMLKECYDVIVVAEMLAARLKIFDVEIDKY
jgi:hypothetical protein